MNVYGRTRKDRLAELAEAVGRRLLGKTSTTGARQKISDDVGVDAVSGYA
jgi:hypothetical protein